VNAGFLRRIAALGAGRCELIESEDRLDEVMTSLHRRISPPLVTGLRVESGELELAADDTTPARMPDLFAGAPCTLAGRWRAAAPPASLTLSVRGDGGFSQRVTVTTMGADPAVRTCWARARIRDLEDRYAAAAEPDLAEKIVAVSLAHRVLSRFTAFVAVDRTRRADAGAPQPVIQPVEFPAGWASTSAAMPLRSASPHPAARHGAPGGLLRATGSARSRAAGTPLAASAEIGAPPESEALVPLGAYRERARKLFARIEADLGAGRDPGGLAALLDELADDLASVDSVESLPDALRRLAEALRGRGDPRAALAEAREAFAETAAQPLPRPAPAAEPESRRRWWR
jgi:Ca-activated chloride channel homolog